MTTYLLRRILYVIPIMLGVNLLLFALFFSITTPDKLAEFDLGDRRVTQEMKDAWKKEHGYHLPYIWNSEESGLKKLTQTIYWTKSAPMFVLQFGKADQSGEIISHQIWDRAPKSLLITVPMFLITLVINIVVAMLVAFYRGTYIDTIALVVCVFMMSISILFYIILGQFYFSRVLKLFPVSGFDTGIHMFKFLAMPILIGVISGIGSGVRFYRTVFLEEINKDYVRTARAKGLTETVVLFKHTLKNAMMPILTNVIVAIPFLIIGSLLLENFFGIPGLGSYLIDAINKRDFAVVRSMVFLISALNVIGLLLVDISYTLVDPRVRFK